MNPYISLGATLLLFLIGTFITIRHFKIVRTIAYIERMNNPAMVSIRADVDAWLMVNDSPSEKLAKLQSDPELQTRVTVLYNIFTEVSIAHSNKIINKRLCYQIWFPLIPKYWWRLKFYIDDRRRGGSPIGYSLEKLVTEIEKYNARSGQTLSDPLADRLLKQAQNEIEITQETGVDQS